MKLRYLLIPALILTAGCSTDLTEVPSTVCPAPGTSTEATADYDPALFPENDGTPRLSTTQALAMVQLLNNMDIERTRTLGELSITDAQYAEIKDFVDANLKGETETETYHNIFSWIVKNVSYAWSGDAWLDPYDVFVNKRCVCQGYANLIRTMCHTQGIPAFNANGMYGTVGAHAWAYACPDGEWIVTDPTNNQEFKMKSYNSYSSKLIPYSADIDLFEDDDMACRFKESHFSLTEVKRSANSFFVVPYSMGKHRITAFLPMKELPENVTQVYLGKNIESVGDYPEDLMRYLPNVQEFFVDPSNTRLSSYSGVIYKGKKGTTPLLVPGGIRRIELRPMKVMEKNVLAWLDKLEELVVAEGTQTIESYAVESCPNLRRVYVPESTVIEEDAFYRCNDDLEIVRVPTGIHEVTR